MFYTRDDKRIGLMQIDVTKSVKQTVIDGGSPNFNVSYLISRQGLHLVPDLQSQIFSVSNGFIGIRSENQSMRNTWGLVYNTEQWQLRES